MLLSLVYIFFFPLSFSLHVVCYTHDCSSCIVLWYMLCDGFTYFSQTVGVTTTVHDEVPYYLPTGGAYSNIEWYYRGREGWK